MHRHLWSCKLSPPPKGGGKAAVTDGGRKEVSTNEGLALGFASEATLYSQTTSGSQPHKPAVLTKAALATAVSTSHLHSAFGH